MNRSLASRIEAANAALITSGNVDAVDEFFAPHYVAHLTDQDLSGGPDAIRKFLDSYRRAFPDLRVEVEILVEAKDWIAWQRTLRATTRAASRASPPPADPSCGVTW